MLEVGMTVKVVAAKDPEETVWVGQVGTLVDISPFNEDGDFFGVNFIDGSRDSRIYFWAEELEEVKKGV